MAPAGSYWTLVETYGLLVVIVSGGNHMDACLSLMSCPGSRGAEFSRGRKEVAIAS